MIFGGGEYAGKRKRFSRKEGKPVGKERIPAVEVHISQHPDMAALSEEIDRVFVRYIRRCLEESPLTAGQRRQVLDGLSARLCEPEPPEEQ